MPSLMIIHVPFGRKRFVTYRADKRLLTSMNSHVYLKVRFLREGFLAALMRAMKRRVAIMPVLVCLESALARKAFIAGLEGAHES